MTVKCGALSYRWPRLKKLDSHGVYHLAFTLGTCAPTLGNNKPPASSPQGYVCRGPVYCSCTRADNHRVVDFKRMVRWQHGVKPKGVTKHAAPTNKIDLNRAPKGTPLITMAASHPFSFSPASPLPTKCEKRTGALSLLVCMKNFDMNPKYFECIQSACQMIAPAFRREELLVARLRAKRPPQPPETMVLAARTVDMPSYTCRNGPHGGACDTGESWSGHHCPIQN